MWYDEGTMYQIYPLGLCGAPSTNNSECVNRISKIENWIKHLQNIGISSVYFSPVFESDAHGYDTRDYKKIDCRLGTNSDFAQVCTHLHTANIRVVLDGVFNHVGRGFWAFLDLKQNRENSPYKDWFHIDFNRNSNYDDGFWYDGWEGHFELVRLNLQNPDVVNYLLECVKGWIDEFNIDGLRLDVAYSLDENFLRALHNFVLAIKPDFLLLGEMLHGDYNRLVNNEMLYSATNYECYKGLYSSFNSMNFFEIAHSLNRQFGPEDWCIYKGKQMLSFVDNHDVVRIASVLTNPEHLPLIYGLLFSMPGTPCIYYGSEWGIKGEKSHGDAALRPALDAPEWNELTSLIQKLVKARSENPALQFGTYRTLLLTNNQFIFERKHENHRVIIAINGDASSFVAHFNAEAGCATDLITNNYHDFGAGSTLEPYSVYFWNIT